MTDSEAPSKKLRKKSGLGRGLSSLIPDIEATDNHAATSDSHQQATLPIADLQPNPFQPRRYFDPASLQELAESIRSEGILQPVLVRRVNRIYQIIAGERRVRAADLAGLDAVPVIVRELDDLRMLQVAIVENIQRNDLSPMEEARAYQQLVTEFGMTQEAVAASVGKSRSSITNFIRLLQLPDPVQQAMDQGTLSMGHGRALLGLERETLLLQAFHQVVEKKLSVRECEALVKKLLTPSQATETSSTPSLPEDYRKMAQHLSDTFGFPVRIRGNASSGRLEIPYQSTEDFDNLMHRLELLSKQSK
ncbi:ParB/RepB/Spo0J family partition protein [Desulfobotulus sp. H1]|uniref:ParB/RepB/Spo0J family partition protein n=1 Tax=Desulfobotulus pelophilus TaxID=2823377 RepID=A0ABT3N735_9BACT|nr:ParB/RepB/Spo0J family partition protein [Desulfobotulus pelophilus]MCW7752852.1 ParB/RepB/Spo0J family partition protein [Desulfobotulus pelophilus]